MKGSATEIFSRHYMKIVLALLVVVILLVMVIAFFNEQPGFNGEIPPIFGGEAGSG